jgi:maltooligosyltrehalose trehalohydrolase
MAFCTGSPVICEGVSTTPWHQRRYLRPIMPTAQMQPAQDRWQSVRNPPIPGVMRTADGLWGVRLWAPRCERLALVVEGRPALPLVEVGDGWWRLDGVQMEVGERYRFRLPDGRELPDPASRHQPDGVHAASAAVDLAAFRWNDAGWRGIPLDQYVIYELHIGTFTAEGTCDAAISHLDELVDLGVTAVELMPVAQCPGERNWGYDGVFPFAVQHSIGGPVALQRLVDACHARGLAVVLDVVYNHLGPEGNHLGAYMPIVSDRHRIPWGEAINIDGPDSDGVRDFISANVQQWLTAFHVDALRLDAVHAIIDNSARPFLGQLSAQVRNLAHTTGRHLHLIAESDLNASRMVRPPEQGGLAMDSQWLDDFHHSLHVLLTGERRGYYQDFGEVDQLRRAFANAYVFDGRWSRNQRMTRGDDASDLPTTCFTVCAQNHDQVGNRFGGERLSLLTGFEGLKFAAACVLLSPYIPLLFMGEEYGERHPFLFFSDLGQPELIEAVRRGRREEFPELNRGIEPRDPFDPATRDACVLDRTAAAQEPGYTLRSFYRTCLQLRRSLPSLRPGPRHGMTVTAPRPEVIALERQRDRCRTLLLLNATARPIDGVPLPDGNWSVVLMSAAACWRGPGWSGEHVCGNALLPAQSALLLRPLAEG